MTHSPRGEHRSPAPRFTSPLDLPFVADLKVSPRRRERSWWATPPATDYGLACDAGRGFGADFVEYLKQDPRAVGFGIMAMIARQMYRGEHDPSPESGYAVGFWFFIETMLAHAARQLDPHAVNEHINRMYAQINERKPKEGA